MKKKSISIILVLVLVGLTAWAVYALMAHQGSRQTAQGRPGRHGAAAIDRAVPVLVSPVTTEDFPIYLFGVGTVKPLNSVVVKPQTSGKIIEIDFTEGQDIKAGDVMARLDDGVYRAQRDQALAKKAQDEALLQNARVDLDRYQKLAQTASGTQQQVDTQRSLVAQYQAQLQSDDAAIESAQATLDYTIIRAPIDGRTGIRNVDIGNLVSASDTTGIVTLSQIKPISVIFSIPQQQFSSINPESNGNALPVEALAPDGKTIIDSGKLSVIDNQVDSTTGSIKLKADFPNEKLLLWPGAFVNTRLRVDTLRNVTTIPAVAVQRGPDGTFAYKVQADNSVIMVPVKVRTQDEQQAVVTGNLQSGDEVVTTGFSQLKDGSKVTISRAQTEEPAGAPKSADEENAKAQPAGGASGKHPHGRKPATSDGP